LKFNKPWCGIDNRSKLDGFVILLLTFLDFNYKSQQHGGTSLDTHNRYPKLMVADNYWTRRRSIIS